MMAGALRSHRWGAFLRRLESAPDSVYIHRLAGWPYLPMHPFADDTDVLSRLGMAPGDCWSADAWWGIDGDAALVQSYIARMTNRPSGLYARRMEDADGWVDLLAVIEAPSVTREAFEAVLSQFAELGFPDAEGFRLPPSAGLVRVAESTV